MANSTGKAPNVNASTPLLNSVSTMLGRGLYFNQAQKHFQQLLLMEERATIARELHDSLAQVLSYLRIQLTLLKRAIPEDNAGAQSIMAGFFQSAERRLPSASRATHHVPSDVTAGPIYPPHYMRCWKIYRVRPRPNSRWIAVYPRWRWMRKCRCIYCKLCAKRS
ncbi:nitrate/nitrite sensor protein NarQ [Salmonella enterica subsp. enterica]|uniref:Nitrate/nitrite sensor protein NarQ n=1 Tax=Salmonella enterica I TaxID=59201 RepID=A0A3S4GHR0_SALET|nr:nitrate/nitrite sensor protein NarQ [Salmonella enterica subsp. enterica]